jgi:hypothetical protein
MYQSGWVKFYLFLIHFYNFFSRGHPIVLLNSKTTKIVPGFTQQHNVLFYFILMTTCFGQLAIIRPSLQNLE